MTVPNKQSQDDKVKKQDQQVGGGGNKERESVFQQEKKLLSEVQEKYKEADLEAEKQIEAVLGREVKAKANIPPDVSGFVSSPQQNASEVIKKDGTLEVNATEEELEQDLKNGVGGKRLIDKTIVGAKSVFGWALRLRRLIKVAHKHAKRVIFRKSEQVEVK